MSSATAVRNIDPTAVDAFEERLVHALNESGMLLMLSIGHRTGLLAAMDGAPPVSTTELAHRTGLQERYVREWLGAMVAARVVIMDPGRGTYELPPEHAALITDNGAANLAVYAQFLPMAGQVEDELLRCFRDGGGVPYDRYPRFHEIMAEDSGQTVLSALLDHILPLAPELPDRLESGIRVLDAGCGRGLALMMMAERYPASDFTGYDLSHEAVDWATRRAADKGLGNVRFQVRDLSDFDRTAAPGRFDLITTFDAIHDQAKPLAVLTGIRRSLADDGIYLAQDIHAASAHHENVDHPMGAFLYAVSVTHCMTVSLAQGGEGLGTMWGREKALEYMQAAGFSRVEVHQLEHDIQNDYFICRP
ncbi:class I SAM-dependent methyltransferase [Aquisalimonas lutea]|uniref:class I SAM-dependent methyltransferase n=1 Tax=Aquisalimonas lutea TaxID=1327750 RepID=UPI0025B3F248|nr:class I SAM-dependent methyltransferase [Aquisalimonas lutea]MDN3519431.1 class I SAM-dependent methyltransferase [Aquisalimonas lutea]